MRKINFAEPDSDNWHNWVIQCQTEQVRHNRLIQSGKKSKVKGDVYKGKKFNIKEDVYINIGGPFYGKCAFCEQKIIADQYGDIEHYRPKNKVSDENFEPVKIEDDGEEKDHPGNYWLCYNWKNLLPSCQLCNRIKIKPDGKTIGKHTRFPVRGFRARNPGEESQEEPLLINPVFDDPSEYLQIDSNGVMSARNDSDRGRTCIEILGLNYRGLPDERREMYKRVRDKFRMWMSARDEGAICKQKADELYQELQSMKNGEKEFSIAALAALKDASISFQMGISEMDTV